MHAPNMSKTPTLVLYTPRYIPYVNSHPSTIFYTNKQTLPHLDGGLGWVIWELALIVNHQSCTSSLTLLDILATSSEVQVIGVSTRQAISTEIFWLPVSRLAWVDVQDVHGVDFLKRAVLGLNDEEVDDPEKGEAADTENHSVPVVNLVSDEGGEERDQEVEQPVGGGSESHTWGTVAGWVQLSNDGPDERSPGGGKGADEEAGEDDQDFSLDGGAGWIIEGKTERADEGVDEEAHEHPCGSTHESLATTAVLDNPQSTNSSDNVDGSKDDGGNV